METDIEKALKKVDLLERFNKLPPSHQREYLNWIEEAKKPQTRKKRIERMLIRLA